MPIGCTHSPNSSIEADCRAVDSASSSTSIPSHHSDFDSIVAGIAVETAAAYVVVAELSAALVDVAIDEVAVVVEGSRMPK